MAEVDERREKLHQSKPTPTKEFMYPKGVASSERKDLTSKRNKDLHHNEQDNSRDYSKTHNKHD